MTLKTVILNSRQQCVGYLYANDTGDSYTAIVKSKDLEDSLPKWWKSSNLAGTPEIVGFTERQKLQCYLIHVK